MKSFDTVTIVGVGLIGASIGLALRERKLARQVVGVGRRMVSLRAARARGAVDRTTTDLKRGVGNADLVVVCTPVGSIVRLAKEVAAVSPDALITDAGSTKAEIVAELDVVRVPGREGVDVPIRFVGSHPLAGDHRAGPRYARADLLEGRTVVVTPSHRSRSEDTTTLQRFWEGLGARVVTLGAKRHDRLLASSSHLPHLVASALAASTPDACLPLAASGWLDTTRIAAGDPQLWSDILLSNREAVIQSLDRLQRRLTAFRRGIEADQSRQLTNLLSQGKQKRDAVGN
ncbi:MAG: prephenate dehydrogenase [Pirellulales bacterium]